MKKFIRFTKRFAFAIIEALFLLSALVLVAFVPTAALVLAGIGIVVRMIGTMKSKASVEFLKRIDEANKASKQSEVAHKKAVKQATVSVKKDVVSKEAKAEAKAFLN